MVKKHHTKRLISARGADRKRWLRGWKKSGFSSPTEEQIIVWNTAYNMGYKRGRRHERTPKLNPSSSKGESIFCELRDIPYEQAKREVIEFLHQRSMAYVSQIVVELRLDIELVAQILGEISQEKSLYEYMKREDAAQSTATE